MSVLNLRLSPSSVLRGIMISCAFAAIAGWQEAPARTTPLGNSVLGSGTSTGSANGVPSPSGPGVHPGYKMVSFRNAIDVNWRSGGIDFLSDGRMVSVLGGFD